MFWPLHSLNWSVDVAPATYFYSTVRERETTIRYMFSSQVKPRLLLELRDRLVLFLESRIGPKVV